MLLNGEFLQMLSCDLSSRQVVWGIGGSSLLALYDLYANPADLDLWVRSTDMPVIKDIFRKYKTIKTNIYLSDDLHHKIEYHGIEVEFVASFVVKVNKLKYTYNITSDRIYHFNINNKLRLPCTLLEDWYVIYRLLNREDKADIIKNYFKNHRITSHHVFTNCLRSRLPSYVKKDIKSLLKIYHGGFQLSLFDCK